jgi:hypothetical protein
MKKPIVWVLIGVLAIALVIQAVPYGHDHTNPPVRMEPAWDNESTRSLAKRACFDCHSNETIWPWYSNIAPVSWLVQHDVDEGRSRLNFSEWDRPQNEGEAAAEMVQEGEMPPWFYLPLHAEARLSPAEKTALIQGLQTTLAGEK